MSVEPRRILVLIHDGAGSTWPRALARACADGLAHRTPKAPPRVRTPTLLVVHPHEGHRFSDLTHAQDVMQRMLAWFDDNMPSDVK